MVERYNMLKLLESWCDVSGIDNKRRSYMGRFEGLKIHVHDNSISIADIIILFCERDDDISEVIHRYKHIYHPGDSAIVIYKVHSGYQMLHLMEYTDRLSTSLLRRIFSGCNVKLCPPLMPVSREWCISWAPS